MYELDQLVCVKRSENDDTLEMGRIRKIGSFGNELHIVYEIMMNDGKLLLAFEHSVSNRHKDIVWSKGEGVSVRNTMMLNEKERSFCKQKQVIEAIKSLRSRSNLGLKEAKDLVDDWCKNQGINPYNSVPSPSNPVTSP